MIRCALPRTAERLHAHWGGIVQRLITLLGLPERPRLGLPPPSRAAAGNQDEYDNESCNPGDDRPIVLDPPDDLRLVVWLTTR